MEIAEKIEELRSRCRENGVPLTQQRIEIYRVLLSSKEHPSPEIIYNRLKPNFPTLSLATVYKNLGVLAEMGLIRKINPLSDHARYDGDISYHDHFICLLCKRVEDVDFGHEISSSAPDLMHRQQEIVGKSIQYYGFCKQCINDMQEEK